MKYTLVTVGSLAGGLLLGFLVIVPIINEVEGSRKPRPELVTIEHDGHLFIKNYYSHQGGILHHPDCKCHVNP